MHGKQWIQVIRLDRKDGFDIYDSEKDDLDEPYHERFKKQKI